MTNTNTETTMSELHFTGLPTGPQVRKLEEAYPDLNALRGTFITHEAVERIIGEQRESTRYKTVTSAWRRKILNSLGIVLDGQGEAQGVGFRVLTHGEQLHKGVGWRRQAARRIRRSRDVVIWSDEDKLTPEQRRIRDYELAAHARLQAAVLGSRKKLGPPPTGPTLVTKPTPKGDKE